MLKLRNITKDYYVGQNDVHALKGIDLDFRENEFVAILGQSGCGKTTLLNIIGGLDRFTEGDLIIDGISTKDFTDRDWDAYRNHRVGFVFQSYNLIPHLDVISNVELALKISGATKEERFEKAKAALVAVGLGEQLHNKPSQMSGGQMQRVAIARALVNEPTIVLADEPTGALDSETSVQIMDILAEVAKDRLVVMVTHNPELADEYASRIVRLKDGLVLSDTNPPSEAELVREADADEGSAKLKFSTALGLSFRNLLSKKGRTLLTAFAGAIGIIGIAAILALSNGVQNYIKNVEEEALSIYPLTIQSSGLDMTSLMANGPMNQVSDNGDEDDEDGLPAFAREIKTVTDIFESTQNNDLASLKEFFDGNGGDIDSYVNSIDYTYDVTPQVFMADTSDGVQQVNPNTSFAALGVGDDAMSSMVPMTVSTDVFSELMGDTSMFEDQYTVVAGQWPQAYNECVMVLGDDGRVPDFYLYALGFKDQDKLDEMITAFINGEEAETDDEYLDVSYDEFLNLQMVLVNEADYYQYDDSYNVWVDKSDDEDYMRELVARGEPISIVGVVVPDPDTSTPPLNSGILYRPELITHLIDEASKTEIVKDQLEHPKVNVFTGKLFTDKDADAFDFSSVMAIDENAFTEALQINGTAFSFDASDLDLSGIDMGNMDMGSVDLSGVASSMPAPDIDISTMIDTGALEEEQKKVIEQETQALTEKLMAGYVQAAQDYATKNSGAVLSWENYVASPEAQAIIGAGLATTSQTISAGMAGQLQSGIQSYMAGYMQTVSEKMAAAVQSQMKAQMGALQSQIQSKVASALAASMGNMQSSLQDAFSVDTDALQNAFQLNADEDELKSIMMSMFTTEDVTLDSNLSAMGYADIDKPTAIDIYPKDFESKQDVIDILDAYNDDMEARGEDGKVVSYTDIVGTLMNSVTTIIDMISYVLIAFVAISLIVSSIMIAIITYISVLERTKEIGILRAIGASKSDVTHIFTAETFIEGLVSGIFGIGVTLLVSIPVNIIVNNMFGVPDVMSLPWQAAFALILISVLLTLIAGWFPSRLAAKKDPVVALRSE